MAKPDRRWQRTERSIMEAFGDMLEQQPLDKVSVTALSQAADINKATFYLHYRDVYDLAAAYARREAERAIDEMDCCDCFFENPRLFARRFVESFQRTDVRTAVDRIARNGLLPLFMDRMASRMNERLHELFSFGARKDEDIVAAFLIGGFFSSMGRFAETDEERLIQVAGDLLAGVGDHGRRRFGEIPPRKDAGDPRGGRRGDDKAADVAGAQNEDARDPHDSGSVAPARPLDPKPAAARPGSARPYRPSSPAIR